MSHRCEEKQVPHGPIVIERWDGKAWVTGLLLSMEMAQRIKGLFAGSSITLDPEARQVLDDAGIGLDVEVRHGSSEFFRLSAPFGNRLAPGTKLPWPYIRPN